MHLKTHFFFQFVIKLTKNKGIYLVTGGSTQFFFLTKVADWFGPFKFIEITVKLIENN